MCLTPSNFKFEILARDPGTRARLGRLHTAHGIIETPAFMPVGTGGTVKALTQQHLEELGAEAILANIYHLYLRPGEQVISGAGGLHRFVSWPRPILTDSGGFQVMSLQGLQRVTEEGVEFRSHLDGSSHFFSPERVVEIQAALGSDICMVLDECVAYPSSHESTRRAAELTGRWARRAKDRYAAMIQARAQTGAAPIGALYGIVQGGVDPELRSASVQELVEIGFGGYALGGLSVGEPKSVTYDTVEFTAERLPAEQPRYLMGAGTPEDLAECVARGIDQFDCVLPTRNARNGCVFTSAGRLVIKGARYAADYGPIDPLCDCAVCRRYSRAYLRHLFSTGEMLAATLATYHNVYFYLDTMRKIRHAIASRSFGGFLSKTRRGT
ncbi:MAG: tRNA guanosine(34) transglycosylase Tgt [Terriglobia bacterium]